MVGAVPPGVSECAGAARDAEGSLAGRDRDAFAQVGVNREGVLGGDQADGALSQSKGHVVDAVVRARFERDSADPVYDPGSVEVDRAVLRADGVAGQR